MAEKLENSPPECVTVQPPPLADKLDNSPPECVATQPLLPTEQLDLRRSLLKEISQKIDDFPLSGPWLLQTLIQHAKDVEIIKSVVSIIFNDSIFTNQMAGRVCINVCVYISRNLGADPAHPDPHAIVRRIMRERATELNKSFWSVYEDDTNDSNRIFRQVVLSKCDEFVAKFKPLVREDPLRFREFVLFMKHLFVVSNGLSLFSIPREQDVCDLYFLLFDVPDEENLDCLQVVLEDSYYLVRNLAYLEPLLFKMQHLMKDVKRIGTERVIALLKVYENVVHEMF